MTFKADDYEKKMGECPRHGEQVMWLACKHVAKEDPERIILGPNRVAVCPACSALPVTSLEEELIVACAACVKGKVQKVLEQVPEDADVSDYVNSLEVYKTELLEETDSGEKTH